MVNRMMAVAIPIVLALGAFHVPTVLTGRVLVSDAPVPEGWGDVVDSAEHGIRTDLDGLYGLRLAGLTCNGAIAVAYFDVLGPFAPARAVVVTSDGRERSSDPSWQLRVLRSALEPSDAASFIPADAVSCAPEPRGQVAV